MTAQPVAEWSVDDVVAMLHQLSLGHVAQPFRFEARSTFDVLAIALNLSY
jgi:hypothetical protein